MKVAEFFAEILLKGGDKAIKDIRNLSAGIKDMRLGLGAALQELYKISAAAREIAVSLDAYQINTGLSAEQLQRMAFQASAAGVSMNELGSAIQKLQHANSMARLGYGWDPIYSRFGLNPNQDPVTQLNQIGYALRRLQATNPGEAHALAMRAGLSDSMYYALMRGTTEQMDKQLILTNKEKNALVKLNQEWNKFWFYLKQIGAKLQVISASLQTRFVRILLNASKGFLELLTRAKDLISANENLKYAVIALGVALAAVFAPWLLVLGAIALILEDIWVYFQGGDSVTGEIVAWCKQSERLKTFWIGLKELFLTCLELVKGIGGAFREVGEFLDKHPEIEDYLVKLPGKAARAGKSIFEDIDSFANWLKTPLWGPGSATVNVNNYFASTGDTVKDGQISAAVEKEQLNAAQATFNRSLGGNGGGTNYNNLGGVRPAMAID